MAEIIERIVGDRALQLGNEEFVRPLGFGNNWAKIRIISRILLNGSTTVAGAALKFGVCSGSTDTFSSNNCVGWFGSNFPNAGSLPYSGTDYNTGGGFLFGYDYVKKIGAVTTVTSGGSKNYHAIAAPISGGYSLNVIDIARSTLDATAYTVTTWNTKSPLVIPTSYAMYQLAEDESLASGVSSNYLTGSLGPFTHTGLPAVMDTLSILWSKSTPTLEIAELLVLRFN